MLFSTSSFCGAQSRSPLTHFEKKKSFDPKTPHIDLFARFFDDHIFLTKIAVSIDSILIMLLLEISGEHVLLMLFSFPQFRLSCKGDNKFTDFGKASEPVKSKFI